MVVSRINKKVTYNEIIEIDKKDKGKEISPFKSEINNIPVIIGLGEVKHAKKDKKISYCYLYLILNYNKILRIGVYEFLADKYDDLLDEDNDIDISLLDKPLLFSFITESYIEKKMKDNKFINEFDSDSEESSEESGEESGDDGEESGDDENVSQKYAKKKGVNQKIRKILKRFKMEDNISDEIEEFDMEHKITMYNQEVKEYEPPINIGLSSWIQKFTKNNNFKIIENEGGGDCFFYTIESAFKEIKKSISVKDMRSLLAEEATEDKFKTYYDFYVSFFVSIEENNKNVDKQKKECQKLKNEYNELVATLKSKKTKFQDKNNLLKKAKETKNLYNKKVTLYKSTIKELNNSKSALTDFKWMKGVNNLKEFREKIQSCDFWADAGAISLLEELLNTKIIILSKHAYENNDMKNVLKCGDMTPKSIEENGVFMPRYYIMVEHNGIHYRLITYRGRRICEFKDIPYGVQNMIVKRCMMSKGKSLYNYIPEFKKILDDKKSLDNKKALDNKNPLDKK
tara:strand:- start:2007 stop:3548 length:1542 start_codon:yes stop_codon:yes gene_type:complete